jgi:hypothetical protein
MAINTYPQIILYDNILTGGTTTFSNADATNVGANVYDYKTTTYYEVDTTGSQTIKHDAGSGNTSTVSAFALQGHNMSDTNSALTLAYSSDDVTYTDFLTITPSDNDNVMRYSTTSQSYRYWRLTITNCAATTKITNLFIGSALDLQTGAAIGFTPPAFGRTDRVLRGITEGGQFTGATLLSHELTSTIKASYLPASWVDTNYEALRAHVMTKPFFYCWDYTNHSDEVAYCWLAGNAVPQLRYSHNALLELSMTVNGRLV